MTVSHLRYRPFAVLFFFCSLILVGLTPACNSSEVSNSHHQELKQLIGTHFSAPLEGAYYVLAIAPGTSEKQIEQITQWMRTSNLGDRFHSNNTLLVFPNLNTLEINDYLREILGHHSVDFTILKNPDLLKSLQETYTDNNAGSLAIELASDHSTVQAFTF